MQPHRRAASVALFVLLFFLGSRGSVRTDEKNCKEWHDNLGGPDSSNYVDLDQIKRSNVDELEVAWTYPRLLDQGRGTSSQSPPLRDGINAYVLCEARPT